MSTVVRLGEKGQITLPVIVRDLYELEKGDKLKLIDLGNGIMEIVLQRPSALLNAPAINSTESYSVDDMKNAVEEMVAEKHKK